VAFAGIGQPGDFRIVTRAHVLAWRKVLEDRALSGATIRRKLAALSSLFEYLCEKNAVDFNPVKGAKRPKVESTEGKTPALGDHQARALLDAPDPSTLKGKRDRAILSVLLYHGLRREELCQLKVRDIHARRGVLHLRGMARAKSCAICLFTRAVRNASMLTSKWLAMAKRPMLHSSSQQGKRHLRP
jgi:site-specific recombinase XerD